MLEYFMTNRISEFFLLHQSIFTTNNLTCKPEADIESAVAMATLQILPSCMNFSDRKLFKTQLKWRIFASQIYLWEVVVGEAWLLFIKKVFFHIFKHTSSMQKLFRIRAALKNVNICYLSSNFFAR